MAKLIQLPVARPADEGEALVIQHLRTALPDTYTLIPNVEIVERGRPAFEYDLIVIAPHAVYVVEVKRWRGGIRGDDYTWLVAGQHRRQNQKLRQGAHPIAGSPQEPLPERQDFRFDNHVWVLSRMLPVA